MRERDRAARQPITLLLGLFTSNYAAARTSLNLVSERLDYTGLSHRNEVLYP